MNPKISIIVPVYNVSVYLHKCIDSILAQSYKNYELILVDDGSTDNSGAICDDYAKKDERIRVIHQLNQGQAAARNFAIELALGDYLGFVDSDDWIEPEMFAMMISSAIENNSDMVICRVKRVNEQQEILEITGYDETIIMSNIEATKEILKDQVFLSYPVNKIYKKSLFDGIKFPANRFFEDTATIYKTVNKTNKVVAIPYIGYNYLFNVNSTCNNNHWNYEKRVKREYDNALAFSERYIFCKSDNRLTEVRTICAKFAYQRIRSFIHLLGHKRLHLDVEQHIQLDRAMRSFSFKDLKDFSIFEKIDLILYRINKSLLKGYIKVIAFAHPMSREL